MSKLKLFLSTASIILAMVGCGVKGPPRPPNTPPELGRGEPSFKRATHEYAFPDVPSAEPTPDATLNHNFNDENR
jgi:hypothetical protein